MNGYKRIHNNFKLKRLGIDSYQETVLFIRKDNAFFKSEGFEKRTRVIVKHDDQSIVATINAVVTDILGPDEVSLSENAWKKVNAKEGDGIGLFHAEVHESIRYIRAKLYGKSLDEKAFKAILEDIVSGLYSDVHLASFITACSGDRLSEEEILNLTRAMVASGSEIKWNKQPIVDKHCVGGLPGNRTTILVVPIVAALGLTIPKTSSRAITSPAGTADTMEVFCPVNLNFETMKSVVNKEGGCVVWGGTSKLSPADDLLIRIERALDLDSVGLMISSVLSKKRAAGSTHVLIDMPFGPSAKVRTEADAKRITDLFKGIGSSLGLKIYVHRSDGSQPVGRGVGPALEAKDVLSVLKCEKEAPQDLKNRALDLAGLLLELSGKFAEGTGRKEAEDCLNSGKALTKFYAICEAQGGFHNPPTAKFQKQILSSSSGIVRAVDNRKLAMLAKLAGAPKTPSAGLIFLSPIGKKIETGQALFEIHADSEGEMNYALDYVEAHKDIVMIQEV